MTDPTRDDTPAPTATPGSGTPPEATAPAAGGAPLQLTPPAPVVAVAPDQAARAVGLDAATVERLDVTVASYANAVATLDLHSPAFVEQVDSIRSLGDADVRAAAAVPNRLLERPAAALAKGGLADASGVSRSLISLRRTVEELDPGRQGDLSPRRLLGILPFGSRLRDYFARYQSSQRHLNGIIVALQDGQAELTRDNASIEQEKANLWSIMERLREYAYVAQKLDEALSARIAAIETTDAERATSLRQDVLFIVRQKVQDLLTQLAVCVQGYLALDVIRKNNLELIKGVDRATTTTVSALRTAVVVAGALADQKLVLDQITALNATTSSLIESTSAMLRQQSGAISEQAAAATVDLARLQAAFDNIYATIDEIDSFRARALDGMAKTVDALSGEIAKAAPAMERIAAGEHRELPGGRTPG